jgi:YVTN family beta-propeller protein
MAGFLALPPPVEGNPTNSSPIAISSDDKVVWSVNPDDDSVSVIRTDTNTLLTKIVVGDEPQSIALTPNGQYAWVANAADGTVSAIKITNPAWDSFSAGLDTTVGLNGHLTTGAEPWNIVCSPDGNRIFVANSAQNTITIINAANRAILGHVNLRTSIANDPDRTRHFQPRGLAVSSDNTRLYVTRFLSFTKPGGRQGDDYGKEGAVAVLNINTTSTAISNNFVSGRITLAPQTTGFSHPDLSGTTTGAFPNQLQSIVLRGTNAYLPNVAASPSGPLRFNLNTHAFVNVISGLNSATPVDAGAINLHWGAGNPEPPKPRIFFSYSWAMGFTTPSGAGNAYVVSAGSDLLVKLNVDAAGTLSFTGGADRTRYIDLNDPANPATSGANAGKNPRGIAVTSNGTRAYVANFVSRNVSVVDLTTDSVTAVVKSSDLPAPGSQEERNLVGAEMFFSSRGHFDPLPGNSSLHNRLSSEGWQNCASCHPQGLTDGVVWQFAAGPRKSVPLNATFNPHNKSEQRVLNYSAIFDEVEDFETNIRNISGPGPLPGGALNTNYGLLIGSDGSLDTPPASLNPFFVPVAGRPQLTVTLPGSTTNVPALTALREWVKFSVRTPAAPLYVTGLPNVPTSLQLLNGREHFKYVQCSKCHGGTAWTVSRKDFTSGPDLIDIFSERSPAPILGNPVGTQYLNRFLRDVGSFNVGVPGQGNLLGLNIGAEEKAAAVFLAGVLQPAQDGLGIDFNNDNRGRGYNPPSLLGLLNTPPYFHNGAAESVAGMLKHVRHRMINGEDPFDATRLSELTAFLESIDARSDPFLALDIQKDGADTVLSTGSIPRALYTFYGKTDLTAPMWTPLGSVAGTGRRIQLRVPMVPERPAYFFRLVESP